MAIRKGPFGPWFCWQVSLLLSQRRTRTGGPAAKELGGGGEWGVEPRGYLAYLKSTAQHSSGMFSGSTVNSAQKPASRSSSMRMRI